MKLATISGIRGQAGSYLAELLLSKGYKVVGIERKVASPDYSNIQHLFSNPMFILETGDITDFSSLTRILGKYKPDEAYNFAAISNVVASIEQPITTFEINYMGVANFLEAIRLISPKTKFYQASSSECFGNVNCDRQNEETSTNPRNPYGASKLAAEGLVDVYKNTYGLFACYSRNYNFESTRRSADFLTRKITKSIAEQYSKINFNVNSYLSTQQKFEHALEDGIIQPIRVGNLDAKRDWSSCKDIVRAIWLMMQQERPDTYVLGSGETHSVRDFLDEAYGNIGIHDWSKLVVVDPKFYRPNEEHTLCADISKAKIKLGWQPSVCFEGLVKEMVECDFNLINCHYFEGKR